jgi:hypothetical protein
LYGQYRIIGREWEGDAGCFKLLYTGTVVETLRTTEVKRVIMAEWVPDPV